MGYRSNRGRPSEIGRPGRFGRVGAAARLAGALLRGGGRPEKGNWGLPDSVWAPVWPWGMREACVIHWSGKRGAAGDGAGRTAWRRLGAAASPAEGVRAVPALGSAGKRVCAHAQDATRPKIRPAGPIAQRRGARRGAAALGRRRAGSGPKGCTAAYSIVPKRTSGRSRSSPSFGSKRRPAQSAWRRRPAAEVGEARGGVDAAMLRAPDLLGSMRGHSANENLGSGRYGAHRWR